MSSGNTPDIDPANNDTLAGTLQFAFYKLLQGVNGMLPAKVIQFDRDQNRVQVQLLIAVVTTGGTQVSRPQIASLPVLNIGGGGFVLSFNLNPGDLGWVIASDRDISLFLQTYQEAPPNSGRVKNFSDGLFLPDIMANYQLDGSDLSNAVLQSIDGSMKITIGTGQITIKAPIITIDGILTPVIPVTGNIFLNGILNVKGLVNPY